MTRYKNCKSSLIKNFTPLMYYFQFIFDVPKHFTQFHMSQPLTSIFFYTGDLPSTKYMMSQAKYSSFTYLNVTPIICPTQTLCLHLQSYLISEARVDLVWPVVVYTFNDYFLISSHYPRFTFNINNTAPYHHQMCNWLFDIIVIETLPKKFMSFKETPKQFSGNGQKCWCRQPLICCTPPFVQKSIISCVFANVIHF